MQGFDYYRYYGKFPNLITTIKGWSMPGFCYMYFFRKGSNTRKHSIAWFFYRIILRHLSYKFGIQIPLYTKIEKGFYIGHFGNIVISHYAIIGKNCNISQGVTIGMSFGKRKGAPVIGDFVWMGANCIITGNIKIGNNVLIVPGAFVNFDVPDHSVVLGNPGKIIPKQDPVKDYIGNCV